MSTKKQKERKKKAHEAKAKSRVSSRRHKMDLQKKQDRQIALLDKKFREKTIPIVKDKEKQKMIEDVKNEKIIDKLQKNYEILKSLEEEYLKEQEIKKNMNQALEAEGHDTLQKKLTAMETEARSSQNNLENI